MFGELAIAYLFLGGVGAGCLGVCSLLDLLILREPFGTTAYFQGPAIVGDRRMVDYAFVSGFVLLATGTACLFFDLGRTDRLILLFASPSTTFVSIGAYCLVALLLIGGVLALIRFIYVPEVKHGMVVALECVAVVLSVAVMLYTGFLLQSLSGVAVWRPIWLPLLFAASSISGGIAVIVLCGIFVPKDACVIALINTLAKMDIFTIFVEAVFAIAFLAELSQYENAGAATSFNMLAYGKNAKVWWLGFVGCGIVVPMILEVVWFFARRSEYELRYAVFLVAAALVVIGAVCLRWSVVDAGVHRDLELEEVSQLMLMGDRQLGEADLDGMMRLSGGAK